MRRTHIRQKKHPNMRQTQPPQNAPNAAPKDARSNANMRQKQPHPNARNRRKKCGKKLMDLRAVRAPADPPPARIAIGDAHAARTSARAGGAWSGVFSPPQSSRGGLVRCLRESAASSSRPRPRASIRARRSLAPLPAPAAGGRGAHHERSREARGAWCAVGRRAGVRAPCALSESAVRVRTPLLLVARRFPRTPPSTRILFQHGGVAWSVSSALEEAMAS